MVQAYKNEYLDEQASLVQGRRALLEESARFSERLSREADKRRLTNEKESGASVRHLQSQLDGLESEVCLIVEQYRAEKPLLDKRIEDLGKSSRLSRGRGSTGVLLREPCRPVGVLRLV